MLRVFFFVCAWISLALGVIGIFVPLLPTTPFVLLAAFLFSKSSPRFEAWIVQHPRLGPAVRAWRQRRAIPMVGKVMATITLAGSGLVIFLRGTMPAWGQGCFAVFAVGLLGFVWTRPRA